MSIFYDLVTEQELEDAHRIEVQGYPEDEAGSLETFQYRQSQAPELFLGAYLREGTGRKLIGYVCSTLAPDTTLTHASMSTHVPGASSVCVHSVCVAPAHRRQRVGLSLLREYVSRLSRGDAHARILLIAHEELRTFYEQAGFEWVGQSAVVHGARPWFEMRKDFSSESKPKSNLDPLLGPATAARPAIAAATGARSAHAHAQAQGPSESESPAPAQDLPPGLWEALQGSSSRARPLARLLSSFPNAVQDVISAENAAGQPANRYDLLCPRLGCGSVILLAGVGVWVERASVQIDPAGLAVPDALGALPVPPATAQWWLVKPSAMAFENVGFSRAVQMTGPNGRRMKLLACAECDLGPLGWCEEGGSEFWLACNRVGYRT